MPEVRRERKFHRVALAAVVVVRRLRAPHSPDRGNDLPQVATGLDLWFRPMYLMAPRVRCQREADRARAGRHLQDGVAHGNLIREAHGPGRRQPLSGEVEMDETYVGGRPR